MPIEQMNISLSPQMARFIRGKVKKGEYTNASEVMREAVRRMQEAEAARKERLLLSQFEAGLTKAQREGIGDGVRQGSADIEAGQYVEYVETGLRNWRKELVAGDDKQRAS